MSFLNLGHGAIYQQQFTY